VNQFRRQVRLANRSNRKSTLPADRQVTPSSKQSVARAFRVMAPTFFALTFASVAHAQGTMDFSGAQTLMGTFKTFAVYAGAVICFGGLIFAGIRMMSGRFPGCYPRTLRRTIRCWSAWMGRGMDWLTHRAIDVGGMSHDQAGRTVTSV
jgi:hypothetical protein